jgi:hypothetical protein
MDDALKFTFQPKSRLIGGNQDAIPDKPLQYDVNLRSLRDGYSGRAGSQSFPGALKMGTALGLAIRRHMENEGLTQYTTRNIIRAAYEFMRFKDVNNIPDNDVIDWDTLVKYQDYLTRTTEG